MAKTEPEVEWFERPDEDKKWGVMKVQGTSEWAVVCRINDLRWLDPRAIFWEPPYAVVVVTTAPSREVAIGYIKLLKE